MNKENGLRDFVRKIKRDKAFRLRLGLFGTLFVNAAYSALQLGTTMLAAFDNGTMTLAAKRVLLAATGSAVSAFIVAAAIYMIVCPKKNLNKQRTAKENK